VSDKIFGQIRLVIMQKFLGIPSEDMEKLVGQIVEVYSHLASLTGW